MVWAIIKTQFEGFHQWLEAPDDVAFLRNMHRHLFYVELWIEQKHTQRDIEYITEKRNLDNVCQHERNLSSNQSCEDIANEIKNYYQEKYPDRKIKVFIFEDNENGCLIE